jgi:hypothetical protein
MNTDDRKYRGVTNLRDLEETGEQGDAGKTRRRSSKGEDQLREIGVPKAAVRLLEPVL